MGFDPWEGFPLTQEAAAVMAFCYVQAKLDQKIEMQLPAEEEQPVWNNGEMVSILGVDETI